MRSSPKWYRRIVKKACCLIDCVEWGCKHRSRRCICLLIVMGTTGALLFCLPHPMAQDRHSDPTASDAQEAGPRVEVASCTICLENLTGSATPLNSRLVWRTKSSKSFPNQEMAPNRDQALWDFPDIYLDSWATWTTCPTLTVLVPSSPKHKAQRDAIRSTWGRLDQYTNCSLRIVFFVIIQPKKRLRLLLKAEHKQFHDMVVLQHTSGMHHPASAMGALLVEWVPAHMEGSQFALRVTDDTHVHVSALLSTLSRWPEASAARFIFGRASRNRQHLEGCAYMAKSKTFLRLQPAFADEGLDESEGALVTGRLARKAGLVAVHLEGIGPCEDREADAKLQVFLTTGNVSSTYLTIRGLTPEQMVLLHRSLSSRSSPTAFFRTEALGIGTLSG